MPPRKSLALGLLLLTVSTSRADAGPLGWGGYWSRALWWSSQTTSNTAQEDSAASILADTAASGSPAVVATEAAAPVTLYVAPGPVISGYTAGLNDTPAAFGSGLAYYPSTAKSYDYDAYINLGEGPYAAETTLTVGGASPWYESPVVEELYGGTPDAAQRAAFTSTVLERVDQAFDRSGFPDVALTTRADDSAAHELSVVSNTYYGPNPDAVGITNMKGDGFSFVDKFSYADSVDELGWAVAHNVAHELMHAFGAEHYDSTGRYLDSATTSWDDLINPEIAFGSEAVADLASRNFRERFDTVSGSALGQLVDPAAAGTMLISPVPEPTTLALWALAGVAVLGLRHSRTCTRTRTHAA